MHQVRRRVAGVAPVEVGRGRARETRDRAVRIGVTRDQEDVVEANESTGRKSVGTLGPVDGLLIGEHESSHRETGDTGAVVDFVPLGVRLGATEHGVVEELVDHHRRRRLEVRVEVKPELEMVVGDAVRHLHGGVRGVARVRVVGHRVEHVALA